MITGEFCRYHRSISKGVRCGKGFAVFWWGACLIFFLLLFNSPVYASEVAVVRSVSGDVYLLSSGNRWERVYEQEKFSSGFRIRTEKNSSVSLLIGGILQVTLPENSLFELNDNFSERSNIISSALFSGAAHFQIEQGEKKIRVVTPAGVFLSTKGKFRLGILSAFSVSAERTGGNLFFIKDGKEVAVTENTVSSGRDCPDILKCYTDIIAGNMDLLRKSIEMFEQLSGSFETLSEKKLAAKKSDPSLMKNIEQKISEILETVLRMNEAKNQINMYSGYLKGEIDEKAVSGGEDEGDIPDIIEKLKLRHQEISDLKKRYNSIISSELVSLFKTYDSLKNGRKKR